jgi:hypothetical protein
LTKPITLESKLELFRDLLVDGWKLGDLRYGIPDCKVLLYLKCSPQSWTRYRPQIIQYCKYDDLIKTELRDEIEMETIRITMRYDKKRKMWYGKRNPLLIKDSKGLWHEMTKDEEEKYDIRWYPEDDYMYSHTQHYGKNN